MHFCGNEEANVQLPAGAKSYPLFQAPSGHLLLRIDNYENATKAKEAGALPQVQRHLLADYKEPPPEPSVARTAVCETRSRTRSEALGTVKKFQESPSLRYRCCHVRCNSTFNLRGCTRPTCHHQSCETHSERLCGSYQCSCCVDVFYMATWNEDHFYSGEGEDVDGGEDGADPEKSPRIAENFAVETTGQDRRTLPILGQGDNLTKE
eukprot:533548-Amphidinium_carterae.2